MSENITQRLRRDHRLDHPTFMKILSSSKHIIFYLKSIPKPILRYCRKEQNNNVTRRNPMHPRDRIFLPNSRLYSLQVLEQARNRQTTYSPQSTKRNENHSNHNTAKPPSDETKKYSSDRNRNLKIQHINQIGALFQAVPSSL